MLFGGTILISNYFHLKLDNVNPVFGELIGFATLTLPVILYFTLSENGKYVGTIGKRKFGLQIMSKSLTKASIQQLLLRNCIKFLPWELAHFFIYRLFYFNSLSMSIPDWVLTGLIVSQGLALFTCFASYSIKVIRVFMNYYLGQLLLKLQYKGCH